MDATITTTPTPTGRAARPARAGAAPAASPESIAPELEAFAVPIGTLTAHPRNPRRGNLEAISESLRRFGQLRDRSSDPFKESLLAMVLPPASPAC
jgi:hypothetical protein